MLNWLSRPECVWGTGSTAPPYLSSALDECNWLASRPGHFTPWERAHDSHWVGSPVSLHGGPASIRQFLIINNQSIQQHTGKWESIFCCRWMAASIYRQQKVLSHFPVCCWIDCLLMIKSCHLSTTKGTFPFSRVLLDWLVINDQKLPSIDNKRYFPIFPCVVGLIGY
jgi:hypothetical protein